MQLVNAIGLEPVEGAQRYTTADHSTPQNEVGGIYTVKLGDREASYVYVKANATLAQGQCVSLSLNYDDADVDAAQAITTKNLTGTGDFTADEYGGRAGWVHIDANGGLKQGGHYVRRNSANILETDRVWDEALTTASDYVVHMLNAVVLADADAVATKHVAGVAIGTITSGNYGFIQISGVHWRVRSVGTTDAAVLGELVMASGTAGACKGWTTAGTAAEDVAYSFGVALAADAEADAAAEGIPVLLTNCKKFWV